MTVYDVYSIGSNEPEKIRDLFLGRTFVAPPEVVGPDFKPQQFAQLDNGIQIYAMPDFGSEVKVRRFPEGREIVGGSVDSGKQALPREIHELEDLPVLESRLTLTFKTFGGEPEKVTVFRVSLDDSIQADVEAGFTLNVYSPTQEPSEGKDEQQ